MTANRQYKRARKTFYDSITWFSPIFDEVFVTRSNNIIQKYDDKAYRDIYTYEQIEQIKYMRHTAEFSRMLVDASSRNRVKLNRNPNQRVELVPVGYGAIISFEQLAVELFNKLHSVQKYSHPRDTIGFFNHCIGWFGGVMDANFVITGYLIQQTENSPEYKYRQLLIAFSKMFTRCNITPAPLATLVYKPTWTPPYSVDEVVRGKHTQEVTPAWQPDFSIIHSTS